MKTMRISPAVARRFLRGALGLDEPFRGIGPALDHLGYVQIDPINVCGRMHDLILRNRVAGYREGDLMAFLHGRSPFAAGKEREIEVRRSEMGAGMTPISDLRSTNCGHPLPAGQRTAFEHHLPHTHVLVAFPLEAWRYLDAAMLARSRKAGAWSGRLTPREKEMAPRLIEEIRARGPLASGDFEDDRRGRRVWGQATLAKVVLQKLFFHGRLLIAGRVNNQRRYDLPERVLPAAVLKQKPASREETDRWIAILKVRQFRLALLKRTEVAAAGDAIVPVEIDGCPRVYCLATDVSRLGYLRGSGTRQAFRQVRRPEPVERRLQTKALAASATDIRLLAPLDPLIYQRRLTSALWDFDYTWEVYTPPAKRVRGYYALPVLSGLELVGHVDPKFDRQAGRLEVISRQVKRGHSATEAIRELGRFLA